MNIITYDKMEFKKYISNKDIMVKIDIIANNINKIYNNENILFIGVLNGCFYFMNDLLKRVTFDYEYNFIKVSSYNRITQGKISLDLSFDLKMVEGKTIIIIEDIIDTGNTINYIKEYFNKFNIKGIKIASLLIKDKKDELCDWFGFKINNKFVIGYGLDINNKYRSLKDIYIKN